MRHESKNPIIAKRLKEAREIAAGDSEETEEAEE